ncbi:MAG: methyl-accepting chemotaxis protein [Firmicutes bacterium]|nr:methyl-accepting chemotaxis protein [Bacillota bacterium]
MFKSLQLKWKISLIITFIAVIVMVVVSYLTYNNTSDMLLEQIDGKIGIIQQSQKNTIADIFSQSEKQVAQFAADRDVVNYLYMLHLTLEGDFKSDRLLKSFSYNVRNDSADLRKSIDSSITEIAFSYITSPDGIVLADSRMEEDDEMTDFIQVLMPEDEYKNTSSERIMSSDGENYLLFNSPIYRNNEDLMGYYVIAVPLSVLNKTLSQSYMADANIQLINKEGIVLNHTDTKLIGRECNDPWYLLQIKEGVNSVEEKTDRQYKIIQRLAEDRNLYLAIDVPIKVINEPVNKVRNSILMVAVIGVILIFVTGYFLIGWQLNPLKDLLKAFDLLGKGVIKEEVLLKDKDTERKDEIGILSKAFNSMVLQLREVINNIIGAAGNVADSSQQLKVISDEVESSSEQVAEAIQEVASGADNQSENIDNINFKMKNLAEGIDTMDRSNQDVETLAVEVNQATEKGQNEIEKVSQQMNNIRLSINEIASGINNLENISNEIDGILEIINSIANQTNLLALNAAIEAARAGEAGRGFTVVADEIRDLAEESASSAGKIRDLIEDIKSETKDATSKMGEGSRQIETGEKTVESARGAFDDIKASIEKVNRGIEKASQAVKSVSGESREITEGLDNIASISEETSASSEEVAASSQEQISYIEEMSSLADSFAAMADELNGLIKRFEL